MSHEVMICVEQIHFFNEQCFQLLKIPPALINFFRETVLHISDFFSGQPAPTLTTQPGGAGIIPIREHCTLALATVQSIKIRTKITWITAAGTFTKEVPVVLYQF